MSIESHSVTEIKTQSDGRKILTIIFTDHNGGEHFRKFRNRESDINIEDYASEQYQNLESRLKDSEEKLAVHKLCEGNDSLSIMDSFVHSTKQDILVMLVKRMMKSEDFTEIECMQSAMEYMRATYTNSEQKSILGIDDAMIEKVNDKYDTLMVGKDDVRAALNIVEVI